MIVDLVAHLLLDIFSVTHECFVYFICVYYLQNVYLIVVEGNQMFFSMAQPFPLCQGLLLIEAWWSHLDTALSVGLLWASDEPNAITSTWQHTTLTTDRHTCPRRHSNPQSQQASGHRPTPSTARQPDIHSTYVKVPNSNRPCLSCWN